MRSIRAINNNVASSAAIMASPMNVDDKIPPPEKARSTPPPERDDCQVTTSRTGRIFNFVLLCCHPQILVIGLILIVMSLSIANNIASGKPAISPNDTKILSTLTHIATARSQTQSKDSNVTTTD